MFFAGMQWNCETFFKRHLPKPIMGFGAVCYIWFILLYRLPPYLCTASCSTYESLLFI